MATKKELLERKNAAKEKLIELLSENKKVYYYIAKRTESRKHINVFTIIDNDVPFRLNYLIRHFYNYPVINPSGCISITDESSLFYNLGVDLFGSSSAINFYEV